MMPLGVSEAAANALTVAVKLTLRFRFDGLPEVLIATDVAAWFHRISHRRRRAAQEHSTAAVNRRNQVCPSAK
jgi:hypothetical protein